MFSWVEVKRAVRAETLQQGAGNKGGKGQFSGNGGGGGAQQAIPIPAAAGLGWDPAAAAALAAAMAPAALPFAGQQQQDLWGAAAGTAAAAWDRSSPGHA